MTSVYTGSPTSKSPIDAVRFKIQDTTEPFKLTDQEILALLTEHNNSINHASVAACLVIAAKYAGDVDRKIGDLSISASQKRTAYLALAESLSGFYSITPLPLSFAGGIAGKPAFRRGLHGA